MNTYGYVFNSPINAFDPLGLYSFDEFLLDSGNVAAGFGDTITFGFTNWIRDQMGTNGVVDKCSGAYSGGEWAGIGYSIAAGGAIGWRAAGQKAVGKEFSHWIPNRMGGPRSKWNGNFVPKVTHALSDPFRYRFMPRSWKATNPMPNVISQQWTRIPYVYKGAAIGAAYGTAGSAHSH